jgi:hypothetical protein
MKYACLIILSVLMCSCNNEKKEPPKPVAPKPAASRDTFSIIREKAASITGLENLEKQSFEIACPAKTTVEYFRHQGRIVRISVGFHKEADKEVKADYFYENDQLIHIFEIVRRGPGTDQKTYSSYISNDKVIRFFWDHGESKCQVCQFDASSKEYKLLKATKAAEIASILCR